MKKMTESKKAKAVSDVAPPQDNSVGGLLRAARQARKMSLEEVSAALRIRHIQLQAIEENNLDELPGITYAVGFVRSYANYLGLNGAEIVEKFKAEQGYAPAQSKLSFPEPISEGIMPDPLMVGVGFFLAVLLLVVWTIYSNVSGGSADEAAQIPPPPVAEAVTEVSPEALPEAAPPESAALPLPAAEPVQDKAATPAAEVTTPQEAAVPAAAPAIEIKRDKTRILLQANQESWVQITDDDDEIIYQRVLRPGDQYYVPDREGLSLVTGNAGGLDVSVDDKPVQPLGEAGEIVRGVSLDPDELKKKSRE